METPMVITLLVAYLVQYAAAQVQSPVSSLPPSPSPPAVVLSTACTSTMYNPCGLGSCVNTQSSYRCICPYGTRSGQRINGSPFCVPDNTGSKTYNTTERDTCYLIALTFTLSITNLTSQNPGLNCNNLTVGTVLNVASPVETSTSTCWIRYTVVSTDTCTSISKRFQTSISALQTTNPGLDCNNLLGSNEAPSICIRTQRERSKFYVCRQYITSTLSSSRSCRLVAKSARRTQLFNPGLYCGRLSRSPRMYCRKAVGYQYFPVRGGNCVRGTEYSLTNVDSCATLYTLFPGSSLSVRVATFRSYNSLMDCKDRFLFVGQRVCVPSA